MDPEAIAAAQRLQQLLPPGVVGTPVAPPVPVPQAPGPGGAPVAPLPPPAGFPVPPGMPPPQMPAPGVPGQPGMPFAPPGAAAPGAMAPPGMPPGAPGQPGSEMVPLDPAQLAAQQQTEDAAEAQREQDAADDNFGQGARPKRGSTFENPLDTASRQIAGELQGTAKRLAGDLFPNGPAGTVRPSQEAMAGYLRRHWDDPEFRQAMLERMAPKGPDGKRVPWGVRAYLDLYRKSIAVGRAPAGVVDVPGTPLQNSQLAGDAAANPENPVPPMFMLPRVGKPAGEDQGLPGPIAPNAL